MDEHTALTTTVENSPIELAMAGWLHAHGKRADAEGNPLHTRTSKAYEETLHAFRFELRRIHLDLDGDVSQVSMVAQSFAASTSNPHKASVRQATFNHRLACISSFYEYAVERYLLMPMDAQGHVMNPIKLVDREKVQAYAGAQPLDKQEVAEAIKAIDRSTPAGARDYALLSVLLNTGWRVSEVASLTWGDVTIRGGKATLTCETAKGEETIIRTLGKTPTDALQKWLHKHYGAKLGQLSKDAPLWVSLAKGPTNGKQLSTQAIADVCQKYLGTSKVHTLRHTFAYQAERLGIPVSEIQRMLNHKSLAVTGTYLASLKRADDKYADELAAAFGID